MKSKFVSFDGQTLILHKIMEIKAFSCKTKASKPCIEWGKLIHCGQSQKEKRLLRVSMYVSFDKWTLILKKMVERKAFLGNQRINIMYLDVDNMFIVANHKKNGHYYECPSLSHLTDELWF